jgi:sugar lactone lactonase YvrE
MQPRIPLTHVTRLAGGLDHSEGVAVLSTGHAIAGGEAGQLYRISMDGEVEVLTSTGGFVLGLCVDAADNVYLADIGSASVLAWSETSGLVTFSTGAAERPFRHPNAMALSAHGLYVTDSGAWDGADGTIHLLAPDGSGMVVGDDFARFPNGIAVSPDGRWLYVAESQFGISRAEILPDGRLGAREDVHPMPGEVPDGLLFDGNGGLLITCYQPNAIYRLDPNGDCSLELRDDLAQLLSMPTNGAWLHDGRLLLANLGGWHVSAVDVPYPAATPAPVHFRP